MKNNNKILEEIIAENPELKDKKKNLSEAIKVLKRINPQIKAPQKFKKDLKKRLTSIIQYEKNAYIKKRYSHIFIPIFATSFAVFGFFYFLPGALFQQENETPIIQNINNKFSEESLQRDIDEIIESIVEEKTLKQDVPQKGGAQIQLKSQVMIESDIGESEKNDTVIIIEKKAIPSSNNIKEDDVNLQPDELENTQLIDLFGDGESQLQGLRRGSQFLESDMTGDDFSGLFGDPNGEGDYSEGFDEGLVSFEDFCKAEGGEMTENDEEEICRKDKKECKSSEYKNGTCEFHEIK